VNLPDQVLEKALELLDRAIGRRQELHRIERPALQAAEVLQLGHRLAAIPLQAATGDDRVPALEPKPDPIRLPKHPA
jgi:hypothetical protein